MSQLHPPSPPSSPNLSPNLIVKGRINIYARDLIATTPLETLREIALEKSSEISLPDNKLGLEVPIIPPEYPLEELPEKSPEELAQELAEELIAKAETYDRSMAEYHQLQYQLLLVTLGIALIIFLSVWVAYSLPTALNYLLGGCTGVVYLKMLARDVERLGNQKDRLGYARLAPFIGLMIIATRWHDLQIVPIFLGFLTYKAAIIVYVLRTSFG